MGIPQSEGHGRCGSSNHSPYSLTRLCRGESRPRSGSLYNGAQPAIGKKCNELWHSRGPYLPHGTESSVVIVWHCNSVTTSPVVKYGTALDALTETCLAENILARSTSSAQLRIPRRMVPYSTK